MDLFPAIPAPAAGVESLDVGDFLEAADGPPGQGSVGDLSEPSPRLLLLDVRSPGEFAVGHIPGAVNLPLFDDDARAAVGTDFKRKGKFEAIRRGLQLAGPNFAGFIDALQELGAKPGSRLLVYCWRGGMRSGSMAWLFSLCGYQAQTLKGGYRGFRRWCKTVVGQEHAPAPAPVWVLGGCTGVGKTAVLWELRQRGEQVIDLEALAHHRGSAFGAIGQPEQPSNEAYENLLAFAVRRVKPGFRLWLEHEARHVGKVLVPVGILSWVTKPGAMIFLSMKQSLRVQRLVEDYCAQAKLQDHGKDELKQCISGGLAKRLGGQRVKEALQMLDEGRWEEVAAMMLDYYDKLYDIWARESECLARVDVDCPTADASANAELVLRAAERHTREAAAAGRVVGELGYAPSKEAKEPNQSEQVVAAPSPTHEGACYCGEVRVRCRGEARAISYCHCSICRRLSGSPFSCQALFQEDQVALELQPGSSLVQLRTSKGVERSRCASCHAPVRGTLQGGKLVAVPLSLLTTWRGGAQNAVEAGEGRGVGAESSPRHRPGLRPMHHLHYNDRVMDVRDGLPKYAAGFRETGRLPESEW
ncbi:selU [Symbiodinium natans]|uniref:SelU protein n=1 Tax=Symbiodinium natans TaxID=878477 RepID=A0A812KXB4_9DINO|nr:selU [Symbiodinium natans]